MKRFHCIASSLFWFKLWSLCIIPFKDIIIYSTCTLNFTSFSAFLLKLKKAYHVLCICQKLYTSRFNIVMFNLVLISGFISLLIILYKDRKEQLHDNKYDPFVLQGFLFLRREMAKGFSVDSVRLSFNPSEQPVPGASVSSRRISSLFF